MKTLDEQLAEIEARTYSFEYGYSHGLVLGEKTEVKFEPFEVMRKDDFEKVVAALKLAIEQRNRRIKLTPTNLFAAPLPIDEWIEAEDKELQAILKL